MDSPSLYTIVILCAWYFILLGISLARTKSDWGSPPVLASSMFLLSSLATLYNAWSFGLRLTLDVTFTSLLLSTIFIGVCLFLYWTGQPETASNNENSSSNDSGTARAVLSFIKLPSLYVFLSMALGLLTLFMIYRDVSSTIDVLGVIGDWNSQIGRYRNMNAYGGGFEDGGGLSSMSNILLKVLAIVAFINLYIGINNCFCKKKIGELFCYITPALCMAAAYMIQGIRLGSIRIICAALIIAWLLWMRQHHWNKQVKLATVFKVLFAIMLLGLFFWCAAWLVGRNVSQGPLDYICQYIGCSFGVFDSYIHFPTPQPERFGAFTFLPIYDFIGRHFGITDFLSTGLGEFRYWDGHNLGNVSTAFRPWYADFGLFGASIVSMVTALFYQLLYNQAKKDERVFSPYLICYAFLVFGLFAMPLVPLLTQTLFTATTPAILFVFWLFGRMVNKRQQEMEAEIDASPSDGNPAMSHYRNRLGRQTDNREELR